MGWDEENHRTVFQRSKEFAEDYRYFPEPDLPPMVHDPAWIERLRASVPELPEAVAARFASAGMRLEDARLLADDRAVAEYVDAALAIGREREIDAATIANWVTGELFRWLSEGTHDIATMPVSPQSLVSCIALVKRGIISQGVGKEVLAEMLDTGREAAQIVEARGLRQISDKDALLEAVQGVIAENPGPADDYRRGKEAALNFLMGQVMRATRGQANAGLVRQLLRSELDR